MREFAVCDSLIKPLKHICRNIMSYTWMTIYVVVPPTKFCFLCMSSCVHATPNVFMYIDMQCYRPKSVLSMCCFFYICVCVTAEWVVVVGFGLCRPRVISRDQASLMSTGSSRGIQASHTALPTPSSPSLVTSWLHTAPCWKTLSHHHISQYSIHNSFLLFWLIYFVIDI